MMTPNFMRKTLCEALKLSVAWHARPLRLRRHQTSNAVFKPHQHHGRGTAAMVFRAVLRLGRGRRPMVAGLGLSARTVGAVLGNSRGLVAIHSALRTAEAGHHAAHSAGADLGVADRAHPAQSDVRLLGIAVGGSAAGGDLRLSSTRE